MADGIPDWTVTSVTPYTDFVAGRGPVEGSLVNFQTTSGLAGSVFVPTVELSNQEKIRAMITERIANLDAVHKMTG